jgi:hypothetical protein
MDDGPRTLLICCGAIAREIVAVVRNNRWSNVAIECLPAHVHNTPERIPEGVRAKIRGARGRYDKILVLFSDCGTGGALDAVLEEEGVERIGGSHCYEVFAGSEDFAAMMAAEPGSFFLTDFLARHFDRLVLEGLGLDRFPHLRDTYFGNYKRVVYLAQSDDPGLRARAEAAARTLGLDYEMRPAGCANFERFIACRRACAAADEAVR